MTSDISQRLLIAQAEAQSGRRQENGVDRISRALKNCDDFESINACCSFLAVLMVELSNGDFEKLKELAKTTAMHTAGMAQSLHDQLELQDEAKKTTIN